MRTMASESPHTSSLFLPVREDSLWLPGELAQIIGTRLVGFKGGNVTGASSFVITLTKDELLVRGAKSIAFSEDDITANCKDGLEFYKPGYDYLVQDFVGHFRCATNSITKIVLGKFGAGTTLAIWIGDGDQRDKKIIGVVVCEFLPKTIMNLANKAADEGFIQRSRTRGYNWHAWPLYRRELERRLRQAAPSATIIVKGRLMDEETFRRLVR